jgi:hypothetical protein
MDARMFHERAQSDEALFNRLCPADKQASKWGGRRETKGAWAEEGAENNGWDRWVYAALLLAPLAPLLILSLLLHLPPSLRARGTLLP